MRGCWVNRALLICNTVILGLLLFVEWIKICSLQNRKWRSWRSTPNFYSPWQCKDARGSWDVETGLHPCGLMPLGHRRQSWSSFRGIDVFKGQSWSASPGPELMCVWHGWNPAFGNEPKGNKGATQVPQKGIECVWRWVAEVVYERLLGWIPSLVLPNNGNHTQFWKPGIQTQGVSTARLPLSLSSKLSLPCQSQVALCPLWLWLHCSTLCFTFICSVISGTTSWLPFCL